MKHGRDRESRQAHAGHDHANNTPPADVSAKMEEEMRSGRSGMVPKEGLVGGQAFRGSHTATSGTDPNPAQRTGGGADVGPTAQAEGREQERHRLERKAGRTPAGEAGLDHERRGPEVTRAELDKAASQADLRVVGHEVSRTHE